jgi:hypothetical protein
MPRLLPILLLALVLAGCGGGDSDRDGGAQAPPRATPSREPQAEPRGGGDEAAAPTGPVTSAEEAVIRGWSDALRRGDVDRAAGYWALPSIASNGGPPIRLVSGRAVRFFNQGLVCGARLESTSRDARYVLAVFRLTERPGAGECGQGTGERARTLFLLRDGKIVQWLRASDPRPPADTPGGTTS